MSSAPRYLPNYSVVDYRQWEGDWELIDGVAVAMTPSPFGPHERTVSRLVLNIGFWLKEQNLSCEIYTNLDWVVADHTVVRPDLMLVFGEQPSEHLYRPPTLAAEVLSDSTAHRDRDVKCGLYLEHGVDDVLLIDPRSRTIVHATAIEQKAYSVGETFELMITGRSLTIVAAELFDRPQTQP